MPKQKWGSTKQYCAEPEADPFESLYRKSDTFYEYMNEVPCKLPKVDDHLADPGELLETINSIDLPAHRLTGKVRMQYLNFLEKLLEGNYEAWSTTMESYDSVTFTPDEVKRCAASIEMKAVQSCMIMSLYRNYVLKLIAQIRKETSESTLHPNLINMKYTPRTIKKECCSVSVQTDPIVEQQQQQLGGHCQDQTPAVPAIVAATDFSDHLPLFDIPAMSLDEKIRNFERKMHMASPPPPPPELKNRKSTKHGRSRRKEKASAKREKMVIVEDDHHHGSLETTELPAVPASVPTVVPPTMAKPVSQEQDDTIMRELEAMFDTGDDDNNIFDSCENQVQINAIISEIEKFHPTTADDPPAPSYVQPAQPPEAMCSQSPIFDYSTSSNFHPTSHAITTIGDQQQQQPDDHEKTDLKKSLWPCEYHMQKMKLRDLLSNIADADYLRYETIQTRFVVLFGDYDDDEDELGPYSPSIELNEVLVASCRQRIAKWVVQALMKPLNEGLIGNRFLFKKLAKHVADSIIYLNQYPDQRYIKNYIVDYFCIHPMISSVEDMY